MSIFITGSCGFMGYHVSLSFLRAGFEVVGVDHMQSPDEDLKEMRLSHLATFPAFRLMKCDLADHDLLKKALNLRKIEFIFHFAGQGRGEGEPHVFSYLYNNVTGVLNFFELIKDMGVPYVVLPKNGLEKDHSFYEASLQAREAFLEAYRHKNTFKIFTIDLENVFGTYSHRRCDILDFAHKISQGEMIYLKKHGKDTRKYVHIDEITTQTLEFITSPKEFKEYEGYVCTQIHLIQILEDILKKEAQIVWGKDSGDSNLILPPKAYDETAFRSKLEETLNHF
jgi:UDP-glucuronate 4-epimerase